MAVLLQIKNACKSYGDQVLFDGAEATITDDVKVGFIGRNGAGKSTLLRILLGEEELDRGEIIRHPKLRLGYLRQHDPFLPGETALGVPDARQRAARLEMRRGRRASSRLKGPTSKAPSPSSPAAGRRASNWRPCCCTSPTCCCSTSRRTFSTCGRRFCWNTSCGITKRPASSSRTTGPSWPPRATTRSTCRAAN